MSVKLTTHLKSYFPWLNILSMEVIKCDIVAGVVAGVLIIPQAVALSTLAGMPPEYGLYTSIFPVLIAAFLGSSWQALSGPNTALCIMIAAVISPYASVSTPDYIMYTITLTFMVGVIQFVFSVLRLGAVFNYFSQTVMVALVTGVGIIIILQQSGNFLGILMNTPEDFDHSLHQIAHSLYLSNPYAVLVGSITVLSGILSKRYFPQSPHHVIAIIGGMLMAAILDGLLGEANTCIDKLGSLSLSSLPLSAPDFSPKNFAEVSEGLIPASLLIAIMGLIQSSVIARSLATKSGQAVSLNREVGAQGISNMVGSFFSCFPACGSFNRSASNFDSGARTPLSSLVSVIVLISLVILAKPLITQLPIAVMAGVLFIVGSSLIKLSEIRQIITMRGENRWVFLITLSTTLIGGVQNGVFIGAFLSIAAYLRQVSVPEIELLFEEQAEVYRVNNSSNFRVLRISGSLFFGSVQRLESALSDLAHQDNRQSHLVIAADYLQNLDQSAADALALEAERRRQNGYMMHVWFRDKKFELDLPKGGALSRIGKENISYISHYEKQIAS